MKYPKLSSKTILAPMAGVNDVAFRLLCREYGCGLTFSEMISAAALSRNNKAAIRLIDYNTEEKDFAIQLFGQSTEQIVKAAKLMEADYRPVIIDFNMGCPAAKIIKQGSGCALLARKSRIQEIIKATSKAISIPFSVKIRSGLDSNHIVAVEIAKLCEQAGAAAITIHPRTMKQAYSGKADWKIIKAVKEAVKIPVIGNGDIFTPIDAQNMLEQTGCDYIMIGRAAMKSPMVFQQINDYLRKRHFKQVDDDARMKLIKKYLYLAEKNQASFFRMKLHCQHFTAGMKGAAEIRNQISTCKDIAGLRKILKI
jgi:tRNA-dihydrouridine synthase B